MATLNIRGKDLSDETAARIKRAARARGWSVGKYVSHLLELHDLARQSYDSRVDVLLEQLGLESVSA